MNTSYYQQNKETILQKRKEHYLKNKEKIQEQNKLWRQANPERMRAYRDKWEKKTPEWAMYHNSKRRAKDAEVPFDIKFEDILIPTHCPVFGTELISGIGTGRLSDDSPSLDRIIPEKGYIKGNIKVISLRANRYKNDMTIDQMEKILAYMKGEF